jgi:sporulation protein YlmC with PRC-barrel domain
LSRFKITEIYDKNGNKLGRINSNSINNKNSNVYESVQGDIIQLHRGQTSEKTITGEKSIDATMIKVGADIIRIKSFFEEGSRGYNTRCISENVGRDSITIVCRSVSGEESGSNKTEVYLNKNGDPFTSWEVNPGLGVDMSSIGVEKTAEGNIYLTFSRIGKEIMEAVENENWCDSIKRILVGKFNTS